MKWALLLAFILVQRAQAVDLHSFEVRKTKFWQSYKAKTLPEKIYEKIPPEMLEYIRADNQAHDWSNVPQAVAPPADFLKDFRAAVADLPPDIQKLCAKRLKGIFFVNDLGGTGYTEEIHNESGHSEFGFVIFDVQALSRTANEWATWKENSPFQMKGENRLVAMIEEPANDSRKNAIQYILLHELGHVVSIGVPWLPMWGKQYEEVVVTPETKFFNFSWKIEDGRYKSKFDNAWPERAKIAYYAGIERQLLSADAYKAYEELPKTNFPTLYAATTPFDDFAETFANYVHVLRLKKPWKISITSSGHTIELKDCWQDPRCQDKRKFIEDLLR